MEIIIGKTAGFCFGVKRAVDGTLEEAKKSNKKIYCLGELVHNRTVIEKLINNNITIINDINEIQETNSKLIIRAHGIDKNIYNKINKKNIEVIDFTCPFVSKIHNIAEEYQEKGYYIYLIGNKTHPETIGTSSHCGSTYTIIENEADIEDAINNLKKTNIKNLLIIVQTTYSKDRFKNITTIIKEKLDKKINILIKNTICNTTEQRQNETEDLSKQVELMIVIGGKNSSNTKKLYDISKKHTNSILIETSKELNLKQIKKYHKIGIIAGASTPIESINDVTNILNTLD